MASLEQRHGSFRVIFRFAGRKFSRSLRTRSKRAAKASLARLEDNLRRVELGTLVLPDDVTDVAAFLLSDGRLHAKPQAAKLATLRELLDEFIASIPAGSLEENTLGCIRTHIRNLRRTLGATARLQGIGLPELQRYVEKRSRERGLRGRNVCATTIKKELATLRTAWRWAEDSGLLHRSLPKRGLRYPKTAEKPPFQTWEEIERKIKRGGLTEAVQAALWDCVFLTVPETGQILEHVNAHDGPGFVYPMFMFAAHTGARRSEMLRSEIDDIDLDGRTALIREKKRVRGKLSTRRVPLSADLERVLRQWFLHHPGGKYTFCLLPPAGSNEIAGELTKKEVQKYFHKALAGTKWEKLRGWHVFRHSFCSNCAAAGIDQRVINAWVGHQTEEMVRRYRHLIPNQQHAEIQRVFGGQTDDKASQLKVASLAEAG